jgi:radical SAM superfamily enzyme YgiQ (UPF0313 family)
VSIAGNVDADIGEVKVLDLIAAGRHPAAVFERTLRTYRPDVVGLSCMTFQYDAAIDLARTAKRLDERIKVVLGGYHPTIAADLILGSGHDAGIVDFVVRGEGEHVFNLLLRAVDAGGSFDSIPNLSYIDSGTVRHNPAGAVLDLEKIKPPARGSRMLRHGFHMFGHACDVVETSRGCTFSCDFCCIRKMYGARYRTYPIGRVLDDIRDARGRGARAIFFVDDNITLDGNRYERLCRAIIDAGLSDTRFFAQVSVKGLRDTPGLIPAMAAAGTKWVFLGVENISDENLGFLDKGNQFRGAEVRDVITELQRHNILIIAGFIIGNPDDTEESIRANYEFAKRLKIDIAVFALLTPYPGTEVREKMLAEGLVTNERDFSEYTCFRPVARTRHITAERLFALREELGYRYPLESGAFWKTARKVTFPFLLKLFFGELLRDPREVVSYFTWPNRK